jgi:uncharacterized protein (UPF0276 family)
MRTALRDIRRDYPISLHCVGLSIGSADGLDESHLQRIAELADELEPFLISDHLSVAKLAGVYVNDLIPLPYSRDALWLAARHVDRIQERLGRSILVENPSRYVAYSGVEMDEGEFMATLASRTGCRILCDVNNIYVSARNLGLDPYAELALFPPDAVGEIHVAGHASEEDGRLLIDTHDQPPSDDVLTLFASARKRFGDLPALFEWDSALPDLEVLLSEAQRMEERQESTHGHA